MGEVNEERERAVKLWTAGLTREGKKAGRQVAVTGERRDR